MFTSIAFLGLQVEAQVASKKVHHLVRMWNTDVHVTRHVFIRRGAKWRWKSGVVKISTCLYERLVHKREIGHKINLFLELLWSYGCCKLTPHKHICDNNTWYKKPKHELIKNTRLRIRKGHKVAKPMPASTQASHTHNFCEPKVQLVPKLQSEITRYHTASKRPRVIYHHHQLIECWTPKPNTSLVVKPNIG